MEQREQTERLTGEVLNIKNEFASYQEFKTSLDADFQEASERFVIIGYKLKAAKDTDILMESGYRNIYEFAEAEYSLDKSQVSRFIRINNEFSEGGYSKRLREEYRRFGVSKLAVMITLPSAVNEELTADYTKEEIRMIRDTVDEEKQRTDIEVMLEQKDGRQQEYTLFGRILYQIGHDRPELYCQMHGVFTDTAAGDVMNRLADILAPAGEAMISVRIPGERKMFLSIKGTGADPVVINTWTNEKESCTWEAFMQTAESLRKAPEAEESWKILYGEEFPAQKAAVAPVQPEKTDGSRPKKPQRVIRTEPEKPQKPEKTKDDNSLTSKKGQPPEGADKNDTDREQNHDKNPAVAPVQLQNDTENRQNDTPENHDGMGSPADTPDAGGSILEKKDGENPAPPDIGGTAAEPADDAHGAGGGDTATAVGNTPGTVAGQPAVVLADDVDGQIRIADMPELLPDNTANDQKQTAVNAYLTALRDNLDKVYILTERGDFQNAEKWLEAVRGTIRKVQEVSEAQYG